MPLQQQLAGGENVFRLGAVQAYALYVGDQAVHAEREHRFGRARHPVQAARGEVYAFVGRLGRQDHGDQEFERRAVFEFAARLGVGLSEAPEYFLSFCGIHRFFAAVRRASMAAISARTCGGRLSVFPGVMPAFLALARSMAARITAFLASGMGCPNFSCAFLARRQARSACSRSRRKLRNWKRARAASAMVWVQGACASGNGSMSMQSTGQGGTHRSQPVHNSAITVCMRLAAPTMASTGQAWMHRVQPMQRASSIRATARRCSVPLAGLSGFASRRSRAASLRTPAAPPGGHWLISASPAAMARA